MGAGPYIVTGGTGFIGRVLVRQLLKAGADLVLLEHEQTVAAAVAVSPSVCIVRGDMRHPAAALALMSAVPAAARRGAVLIHLAALHHIPTCTAEPRRAMDINVLGTQTLLDAAMAAGIGRVVLASTAAVYGWSDRPMAEDFPLAPCDTYGISKQANEHQLDVWVDRSGGSGRIARIFNVVGRDDPNGHLVPDLLTRLAAAARGPRPFRLELGALTPARDYLHIEDAADGLKMLADDRSADRLAAYNLCRGQPVSVADLARRLMDLTGIDAELVSREAHLRRRDRPMLWGDPGLIRAKLGWQAGHSLEDALRDIIAAHPDFSRTPA